MPILALDSNGSVMAGAINFLANTDTGYWIIDYKTDEIDDREARFKDYLPQLLAYAEAWKKTRAAGRVCGVAVFWVNYGEVCQVTLE